MDKMNFKIKLKRLISDFNSENDLNKRVLIAEEYNSTLKINVHLMEHPYDTEIPNHEVWRNIKGYEGIYQISNFGNLKSLERFFIKKRKGSKNKMAVYQPERIRTKRYSNNGYLKNSLWLNGNVKYYNIHRLVAGYFVPNTFRFPQVLHKDDNPSNARWDNLEWGTQSKNIQDASDRGRGFKGSKNGNSKIKEDDVLEIRKMLIEGKTQKYISSKLSISQNSIGDIHRNKTWRHIK